jgi:two-component system sensor histidine kinase ComP
MDHLNPPFKLFAYITVILPTSLYLILATLVNPYIGISIAETDGRWVISHVHQMGWAEKAGLQPGDRVIRIDDDLEPGNYPTIQKFNVIEKADRLEVIKDGTLVHYSIPHQVSSEQLIYHTLLPTLFFFICMALCFFLYHKKKQDKAAISLILFFLAVSFAYLSAGSSDRADEFGKLVFTASFGLIPILFLHFVYNYFTSFGIDFLNARFMYALYFVNVVIITFQGLFTLNNFGEYYSILTACKLILFSVGVLISIYFLVSRYLTFRKTSYKPILQILYFGVALAFLPFIVLTALPRSILGYEMVSGLFTALCLIILPIVFLYLILANRLLDIDFILNRARYYSILAILPAGIIVAALIPLLETPLSSLAWVKISLLIYLGTLGLLFLKERLDYLFRAKLFRAQYHFQASLDQLSQDLSTVRRVSDLKERVISEVQSVLRVRKALVLDLDLRSWSMPEAQQVADKLMHCTGSFVIGDLVDLQQDGACVLIGEKTDKLYFLWLGEKLNRTSFNQDEQVWLNTMAHYVSIVYKNLHFIEGLVEELEAVVHKENTNTPWVARLLFNLTEKERRLLASELHDSALQEQLLWYRRLESLCNTSGIPLVVQNELNDIREGLLDVIYQIRETCNELRPPFLKEMGLVEAVEILFEYKRLRTDYMIHFDAAGFVDVLDDEQSLALYRIVQELLMNAAKHSKAMTVSIRLTSEGDGIRLIYRDNGVGMNVSELKASFQNMGLSGIKERVYSLGGSIEFFSKPKQGFEVSIWHPVDAG